MKNSKKHNKLGVKFLASVLSVITFSSLTAPHAKAKEVGSGNSVVRRIKKVGLRANESAKGVWTKIWTWMKNHPKTTIAIGTTVGLAIVGTVGFVCCQSHKGKADGEPQEEKPREEEQQEEKPRKEEQQEEKPRKEEQQDPTGMRAEINKIKIQLEEIMKIAKQLQGKK